MESGLSNIDTTEPSNPSPSEPSQPDGRLAGQEANAAETIAAETIAAEAIELGIAGLAPGAFDLLPGGMYALKARTSSARFPLFASLMSRALTRQRPCFLITASKPQDILSRLDPLLDTPTAALIEAGSLRVFATQADMPKRIFRFGPDRFAQELAHFGLGQGALLIYDQADDLISVHDLFLAVQQVDVLGKWFQNQQVTALLSFSRPSDRQEDSFNALMDYFSGIARLGGDKSGLELTFQYWLGSGGAKAAINYRLSCDPTGHYQAVEAKSAGAARPIGADVLAIADRRADAPLAADDGDRIVRFVCYNDPELDTLAMEQGGTWLRVEQPDEIRTALIGQPRGTLALNAGDAQSLQAVARFVHGLRTDAGNRIQIVVYVSDRKIGANESQLLLRCGANLVLGVFATEALTESIASVRAQVFARNLEADFDAIWRRHAQESERAHAAKPLTFATDVNPPSSIGPARGGATGADRGGYSFGSNSASPDGAPRAVSKAKRTSLMS